jgi:hypothetical protein
MDRVSNRKSKNNEVSLRLKSMIKSKHLDCPRVEKAKLLIEEIEAKSKKNEEERMIEAMKYKLDLLINLN